MLLAVSWRWRQRDQGTAKQPGWPFRPGQTCAPLSIPHQTPLHHQGAPGHAHQRPVGLWPTLPQGDTREVPAEGIHQHLHQTLLPKEIQLDFYPNTLPLRNSYLFLHRTSLSKSPWHNPSWSSITRAEGAECGGNLFLRACIIPAVNVCIWPAFLGLLYRAVDAVQSTLLSVPDKMAIKDWVRGQAPKAISTPKWLIIIMCGLNQEPVMSCIH